MSEYLFAYGTLRPGLAPEGMARVVERLEPVGSGFVRGVLYDLGEFPGAVIQTRLQGELECRAFSEIHGVLYRLPEDAEILRLLDEYEGYEPECPGASLFQRVRVTARLADGREFPCWVFAYNRPVDGARVVLEWPG